MRDALDNLPDCLYVVFFTQSLEHTEHDLVPRRCTWRLLGAFFHQELGIRPAELGAVRLDDFFAQQFVVVVHLVRGSAFCRRHCALSRSVKALTDAHEQRFRRPSKLQKLRSRDKYSLRPGLRNRTPDRDAEIGRPEIERTLDLNFGSNKTAVFSGPSVSTSICG